MSVFLWILLFLSVPIRSKEGLEVALRADDLEYLVSQGLMSRQKSLEVWRSLVQSRETTSHISPEGFIQVKHEEGLMHISYGIWAYILLILLISLAIWSYSQNTPSLCFIGSLFFTGVTYQQSFHIDLGVISGSLLIISTISFLFCFHSFLCVLSLSTFSMDLKHKKPFLCVLTMAFSYFLSCKSRIPLVQLPFFILMDYLAYAIGDTFKQSAPSCLQPFWVVIVCVQSAFTFLYFQLAGPSAFVLFNEFKVDFRLIGNFVSSVNLFLAIPTVIFTNYYHENLNAQSGDFSIRNLTSKFNKSNFAKLLFYDWKKDDALLLLFLVTLFLELAYGIYAEIWTLIIFSHFSLSVCIIILPRTMNYFPDYILFPLIYIPILTMPLFLESMNNAFSDHVPSEIRESFLWSVGLDSIRFILTFFGLYSLGNSHLLVTKEARVPNNEVLLYDINGMESSVVFVTRYLLTLILLSLYEQEKSSVIGILYNIAIIGINYQPIIHTTVTRTDIDKVVLTGVLMIVGLRLTLVAQDTWVTFYLGVYMMLMCVYRNIQCAHLNDVLYLVAFIYASLIIIQAWCLKNPALFSIGVFAVCVSWAKESHSQNWQGIAVVFFFTIGAYLYSQFSSFEEMFASAQQFPEIEQAISIVSNTTLVIPEKQFISDRIYDLRQFIIR